MLLADRIPRLDSLEAVMLILEPPDEELFPPKLQRK